MLEVVVNMFDPIIVVVALVTGFVIRKERYRFFWVPLMAVSSTLGLHAVLYGGGSPSVLKLIASLLVGLVVAFVLYKIQPVTADHKT